MLRLERFPELWFEDGNVVFQTETAEFRVYRGILAARSSVFRNMLSVPYPRPSFTQTIQDDEQAIRLPDSAQEIRSLFSAIFDSSFFERPPVKARLSVVLAIARMGHKYDVAYLLDRALEHLAISYPRTLDNWDKRDYMRSIIHEVKHGVTNNLSVLNTALQINATTILPAAFYACARRDLKDVLDNRGWCELGETHKRQFLLGYVKQTSACKAFHRFLRWPEDEDCQEPSKCERKSRAWEASNEDWFDHDPLEIWDNWDKMAADLCRLCFLGCKEQYLIARQEFWDSIPELFGLSGWGASEDVDQTMADST